MPQVYFDESGFTGADLLQRDQPVFVSASACLDEDTAKTLLAPIGSRGAEISHRRAVKVDGGPKRIAQFVSQLVATSSNAVRYYSIHKRFALLAKLIDNWIEPTMRREGFNLYEEGGARAYSNMMFYCMPTFIGVAEFNALLTAYQEFSRDRTPEAFDAFFGLVGGMLAKVDKREGLQMLADVFYGKSLGYEYLNCLDRASNDVALPAIFQLLAHWDSTLDAAFGVVHDESKNVEGFRQLLETVMGAKGEQQLVGQDGEYTYRLPFRAEGLTLARSQDHPQLQVVDLVAGAAATLGRHVIDRKHKPEYVKALVDAGLEVLCVGMMWPDPDDAVRRRPPAPPEAKDPLEVMTRLYREKNADLDG